MQKYVWANWAWFFSVKAVTKSVKLYTLVPLLKGWKDVVWHLPGHACVKTRLTFSRTIKITKIAWAYSLEIWMFLRRSRTRTTTPSRFVRSRLSQIATRHLLYIRTPSIGADTSLPYSLLRNWHLLRVTDPRTPSPLPHLALWPSSTAASASFLSGQSVSICGAKKPVSLSSKK